MREQELEVVKTAYFLEDQIVHQTQELQRVNGDKPARPAQPREPHLEKHSAQKIHQRFVIQGDEILTQIHWYCAGTTVTFLGMAP